MQQKPGREVYIRNRKLLAELRQKYESGVLSSQQFSTLRGQVLCGDADGAVRGLVRILAERKV